VLVRTYERMPADRFDPALAAYAPEAIERLADLGVLLVGIDTASIDPAASKSLPSHQVIRARNLRVLENLVLDGVPEGDYELIALPLKLTTADASPVRAVLRELTAPGRQAAAPRGGPRTRPGDPDRARRATN
jgi:arylformamidase